MKQFRLVDNALGWLAFLIAAFCYVSTIEPTASFWDCPEFISTGYKLEVGHPPGAPFFMLTANLFSQLVSDPSQVARMVNTMSALLSAVTILFLFWTITHLVRRLLIDKWEELTAAKMIVIEASGMVGALIYAWSDTFWFSAVEGEVYAYSSAFTAVVFWLILKWEDHADEPHADRWLILIFYMTGLSIGVHLLNLLCLPAIVLVWYYKRNQHQDPKKDLKGSLIALGVSVVILAAVLYGVVPGIVRVGGWFELLFVNVLGCPFNTGEIIYMVLLISITIWAIYETYVNRSELRQNIAFVLCFGLLGIPFTGWSIMTALLGIVIMVALFFILQYKRAGKSLVSARLKNTSLLCMLMLIIGYSSYAVIVIRSAANPPMDQNSPEDFFTLGEYMGREQYGTRPLFYGPAYTSQVELKVEGNMCRPVVNEGDPVYQRKEKASPDEKDEYFVVQTKDQYKYAQNMLFPRMYDSGHASSYEQWMNGVDGTEVPYDRCGEQMMVKVPSQIDNIWFFITYQCNFMYWRYFMWNFAGRQNDLQGNGEPEHGNWITGISFLDDMRLGNQDNMPDDLKNNKGHNVFYCLPLILGLLGLFWQSLMKQQKGIRQFWIVFFLFFMTGLAIVFYLNQTPNQPRERDYAYAGSFYAYAIWCGMGVAAIWDVLKRFAKKHEAVLAAICGVAALLVPIQMVSQTWDDHDRSGRYTCRDFGQNYLMSLQDEGNPIVFTNGDNDTFPLWYNQDVEGVRTDARVCNLSYLQTDWYIDQMIRPAYDSPSLPITWPRIKYAGRANDYVQISPEIKGRVKELYDTYPEEARTMFGDNPFELKNILKYWVRNDITDQQREVMQLIMGEGNTLHVIPTDSVYITIDKEAVRKSGVMMACDSIPDQMVISLKGRGALYKNDLMMLEMVSQANWTRPIYVAMTVGEDNYMNLWQNFVQEGLVNRITPFTTTRADANGNKVPATGAENFDTDKTLDMVMNRFKFGGLETEGLYLDETVMRMCYTHRRVIAQLVSNLTSKGRYEDAKKVLAYSEKVIPTYNVPDCYDSGSLDILRAYATVGDKKMAKMHLQNLWKRSTQYVNYYYNLPEVWFLSSQREILMNMYALEKCADVLRITDPSWSKDLKTKEFINPLWQHSVEVIKQNMASGRIMSADDENYMHFVVLQHLSMLMEALEDDQYEKCTNELIDLMTNYREKGGSLN
jgi:hypothetical protein